MTGRVAGRGDDLKAIDNFFSSGDPLKFQSAQIGFRVRKRGLDVCGGHIVPGKIRRGARPEIVLAAMDKVTGVFEYRQLCLRVEQSAHVVAMGMSEDDSGDAIGLHACSGELGGQSAADGSEERTRAGIHEDKLGAHAHQ